MADLEKLRALSDAATPGPWGVRTPGSLKAEGSRDVYSPPLTSEGLVDDLIASCLEPHDAEFIAAARAAVPALIARVEHLAMLYGSTLELYYEAAAERRKWQGRAELAAAEAELLSTHQRMPSALVAEESSTRFPNRSTATTAPAGPTSWTWCSDE